MTAKDSKSTPKKAEDAPRQALELLADYLELKQAVEADGTPFSNWSAWRERVRPISQALYALDPAALRAQAEADKGQARIDLQEHFSVIRNVLYGAQYTPQHLRALLDSPYNAQRERDTANGLGAALAQAGGDGQ